MLSHARRQSAARSRGPGYARSKDLDFFRLDRLDTAVKQQNTANFLRCARDDAQRRRENPPGFAFAATRL